MCSAEASFIIFLSSHTFHVEAEVVIYLSQRHEINQDSETLPHMLGILSSCTSQMPCCIFLSIWLPYVAYVRIEFVSLMWRGQAFQVSCIDKLLFCHFDYWSQPPIMSCCITMANMLPIEMFITLTASLFSYKNFKKKYLKKREKKKKKKKEKGAWFLLSSES